MDISEDRQQLFESLSLFMAKEIIPANLVLPALLLLKQTGTEKIPEILTLLDGRTDPEFDAVKSGLVNLRKEKAAELFNLNKKPAASEYLEMFSDLPPDVPRGWKEQASVLEFYLKLNKSLLLIKNRKDVPQIKTALTRSIRGCKSNILSSLIDTDPEKLISELWYRADDSQQQTLKKLKRKLSEIQTSNKYVIDKNNFLIAKDFKTLKKDLDSIPDLKPLISWPGRDIAEKLKALLNDKELKDKLELLLIMRFGAQDWETYLDGQINKYKTEQKEISKLTEQNPAQILLYWCSKYCPDEEISAVLKDMQQEEAQYTEEQFIEDWQDLLNISEKNILRRSGQTELKVKEDVISAVKIEPAEIHRTEDKKISTIVSRLSRNTAAEQTLQDPVGQEIEKENENPALDQPSIWRDHMKPFLSEYWFLTVGVFMVIGGCSLVAYIMWDKHWLIRYTFMPALLAGFTWGMAFLGKWIHSKGDEFKGISTILYGAAILMLPVNCMTLALISNDTQVPYKEMIIPAMGTAYLLLARLALLKWLTAVSTHFKSSMTNTVLAVNALVILAPLASAFGIKNSTTLFAILGGGFYLGFGIMAFSTVKFAKSLTAETLKDKYLPWFFGAVLPGTFIQVFCWVHGQIRHLPEVFTYAPMIILTAGLIFIIERRSIEIKMSDKGKEAESFLGYALIICGILMGAVDPATRLISIFLAGLIWLRQAVIKESELHYYIAVSLFLLIFASIGLHPGFPPEYSGFLGIGALTALIISTVNARNKKLFLLGKACLKSIPPVILITVTVAAAAQWKLNSAPLLTCIIMVACSAVLLWLAYREDQVKWVHSALFLTAMILPYAGCINMELRTLEGNTLVFGLSILSILWISAVKFSKSRLLEEARSTVLWYYGILAMTAMIVRVVLQRGAPVNPEWYGAWMDYCGPLLMTAVLALATYFSRSLIPAFMAAVIAVILFPELKANFRATANMLGFGSGLGSSASALICIIASFILRRASFLKGLKEKDKFLKSYSFPLQRFNHSLFTWPLMLSAGFLIAKTGTYNFIRLAANDSMTLKSSAALLVLSLNLFVMCNYYKKEKGSSLFVPATVYLWLGLHFLLTVLNPETSWPMPVFFAEAVIFGILLSSKISKLRNHTEVYAEPAEKTLGFIAALTAIFSIGWLVQGNPVQSVILLIISNLLILFRYGYKYKEERAIYLFYSLLLTSIIPWTDSVRIIKKAAYPLICLPAAVLLVNFILEKNLKLIAKFRTILNPLNQMSALNTVFCCAAAIFFCLINEPQLSSPKLYAAAVLLIFASRAHSSRILSLAAITLVLLTIFRKTPERIMEPLHLSLFGLTMAIFCLAVEFLKDKNMRLVAGFNRVRWLRSKSIEFLIVPALITAGISQWIYSSGLIRDYLIVCYINFAVFVLLSRAWKRIEPGIAAVVCLILGNIHLTDALAGSFLMDQGLSRNHIYCLGLGLTLLLAAGTRKYSNSKKMTGLISTCSILMAFAILALLSLNYLTHPDLVEINNLRFAVSGIMALLAALYLRYSARNPIGDEANFTNPLEGLYHAGISLCIWCLVLMIPFFRSPATALTALVMPVLYFYLKAEFDKINREKYLNSCAFLSLLLIGLYIFRNFFQMTFFPEMELRTDYYHNNALTVTILGVILCRLHALGGSIWLPFTGGLTVIGGTFFLITALPGLSPFEQPLKAAWAAIFATHFWILLNREASPLRSWIQNMSRLSDGQWLKLRMSWGRFLLAASQIMLMFGLAGTYENHYEFAPLLAAGATTAIHLFIVRRSVIYLLIGAVELIVALHADFFIESYILKESVVWVILGCWVLWLAAETKLKNVSESISEKAAFGFAGFALAHICYLRPWNTDGFTALIATAILALTVRCTSYRKTQDQRFLSSVMLLCPSIIVYFSGFVPSGEYSFLTPLPFTLLTGMATLISIYIYMDKSPGFNPGGTGRFYNLVLEWINDCSSRIIPALLMGVTLITAALPFLMKDQPFTTPQLTAIILVSGFMAVCWGRIGKNRSDVRSYLMAGGSVFLFFMLIRRQIVLTTDFWIPQYDIWFSLIVSLMATGLKNTAEKFDPVLKAPVLFAFLLIPASALAWSQYNNLGTDMTLMIIGINSLSLSFAGKDDKASVYSFLSVSGFVAFTIITLLTKLHIQTLHIYIIPTGIGILILLQLFKEHVTFENRNRIRLFTLTVMTGTAGYYALINNPASLGFNLTLIFLCLASMGLGALLKIKLYMIIGFTGLIVNIISIIVRTVITLDRGAQMTVLGSTILVAGSAVVFGTLYYKTHQELVTERMTKLKGVFGKWE